MANLPPEAIMAALSAVHKTGVQTDPNATANPAGGGGGGGAQSGSAPTDPSQDPNAQGGAQSGDPNDPNAQQDPNEQAVWDEFPSTDPNAVGNLAQQMQGGDPQDLVSLLGQWMQQAQADQDKLSQMQESLLSHLMDMLGGPAPDGGQAADMPTGQAPVPGGPGVTGGNGTGY